jgi:hypothetical protein
MTMPPEARDSNEIVSFGPVTTHVIHRRVRRAYRAGSVPRRRLIARGHTLRTRPLIQARRHNLPTQLTSFVGRVHELADMAGRLGEHRLEAVILSAERGVSGSTAGVRSLDERGAEPGITFARLATLAFARALVVARPDARPGREVGRGREPGHV